MNDDIDNECRTIQPALPRTIRWCSKCGEEEGSDWFKIDRCDTKGGEDA